MCGGGEDPVRLETVQAPEDVRGTGSRVSGGSTRGKVGRRVPGQGEEREGASGSFHSLWERKLREWSGRREEREENGPPQAKDEQDPEGVPSEG